MGNNLCGCNADPSNNKDETDALGNHDRDDLNLFSVQNVVYDEPERIKELPKLQQIYLENRIKKIQSTFRSFASSKVQVSANKLNQNINSNLTKHDDTESIPDNQILSYTGFRNNIGQKEGYGKELFTDGSIYQGQFSQNKFSGWGIYNSYANDTKTSNIFQGEFSSNIPCGFGIKLVDTGITFIGNFSKDYKIQGVGYETWEDNSSYSGEYLNGKKHGLGSYFWKDGTKYTGEWFDNNIEGFGIYYFNDGRSYKGEWSNNMMNGYGEFFWTEGKKYLGYYKNDKKDGFGIYYWPEGKIFVGFWSEGKQDGLGKYMKINEDKYGLWFNGKKNRWLSGKDEFLRDLESNGLISYQKFFNMNYEKVIELIRNDN